MIHSKTRNLSIVKTLSKLGLCISKHRLEQISTAMGNAVIDMNEREGVVLPMSLEIGLFSTASIDNIDVSTKSSTAVTSLHGTAGSINQHVSNGNEGEARSIPESLPKDHKLKKLPDWYTEIPPAYMPSDTSIPKLKKPGFIPAVSDVDMLKDKLWLEDPDCPSWAVFHARIK